MPTEPITGWGRLDEVIYPLEIGSPSALPPDTDVDPIKSKPIAGAPTVTILSIDEIINRRKGFEDVNTGERGYTRVFQVIADQPINDPRNIFNLPAASGLPQPQDPYVVEAACDLGALVVRREATEQESSWLYHVEITYSSTYDIKDPRRNTTQTRARVSSSVETVLEAVVHAIDPADPEEKRAIPVAAASGELYTPAQMVERGRLVLTFTRRENLVDYSNHLRWAYKVNKGLWFGFKPRMAKVTNITSNEVNQDGADYFDVTYTVKVDERGWDRVLLNQGYYQLVNIGTPQEKQLEIWIGSGAARTPQMLAADGSLLPSGQQPVYRAFRLCRSIDFSEMRIPI
jgi:hypothetical protein